MSQSAYVNLWELITTVASPKRDLPNQAACEALQQMCGKAPSFASELSLEVEDNGFWTVKVFSHEDSDQHVTVRISPHGRVTVTRGRTSDDVYEERKLTF